MGRRIGSGLHDDVLREERECPEHGRQPHALRYQGSPPTPKMVCMQHERDANARSEAKRKAGIPLRTYAKSKPEKVREQCPECFTELPATRICDCGYIPKEKVA